MKYLSTFFGGPNPLLTVALVNVIVLALTACPNPNNDADPPYIAVISKGESHQFWQQVSAGAQAAGSAVGAHVTYDGPDSGDRKAAQATMFDTALANDPVAIALASIDTSVVLDQINQADQSNIPIVGFDSGLPDAPAGSVVATAATDNYAAGEAAA